MKSYREALATALAGIVGGVLVSFAALAAPSGIALVVGNAAYTSQPALPGCAMAAHSMSAALRDHGYDVIERSDVSTGQLDAATGLLSEKLDAAPGAPAVIYLCGYVAGLNGRAFVVPVSAALQRPSDVMTQGMLAKSFVDLAARAGVRTSLVVLEAMPVPGSTEPLALDALDRPDLPPRLGILAVTEAGAGAPTPLTTVLMPRLKGEMLKMASLIDGVSQDLGDLRTAQIALRRASPDAGYLFGEPPPPPVPPPAPVPPPVVAPAPPPPPVAAAVPVAPPPSTAVAPPEPQLTSYDEMQMTDVDRRTTQVVLARLGYYPGPIDGIFGPDTRAAIRRLQYELHAPMTGQLTGEQVRRLMAHR